MSQTEILQSIIELLPRVAPSPIDPAAIGRTTRLVEDLGLSSLSLVSLMFLCAERFSVDLTTVTDKLYGLQTLGDAADLLRGMKAQ